MLKTLFEFLVGVAVLLVVVVAIAVAAILLGAIVSYPKVLLLCVAILVAWFAGRTFIQAYEMRKPRA